MKHLLDNPAWNALNTGNISLANGNANAKYFSPDVSPFSGIAENTAENFKQLYELTPAGPPFGFISAVEVDFPQPWKMLRHMNCVQMVCHDVIERPAATGQQIVPLTLQHVPAMLALTRLTNPGPFLQKTIEMGHYQGIFNDGALIAMAGQRLNPVPYAEISAVCTHPDHLGKGYAASLILNQVKRIKAAGGTPFLHALAENTRAIELYKSLGFVLRTNVSIYIIGK